MSQKKTATDELGAALGRQIAEELGLERIFREEPTRPAKGRPGLRKARPFYTIKVPQDDVRAIEELRLAILTHGTSALGPEAAQLLVREPYVTMGLGPVIGFAARVTLDRIRKRTGS